MMALPWLLLVVLPAAAAAECQAAAVIVSPGARVDSGREVKLTDAGGAGCEACWELTHPALAPIGGCFEAGTTVDVALPANGGYVARLRLRDVATQAVVAEAVREFVAGPPEKCAARLRARSDLATNYREAIEREGRRAFGVEGNGSAVQRSGGLHRPRGVAALLRRSPARRARRCSARRAARAASGASTSGGRSSATATASCWTSCCRGTAPTCDIAEFGTGGGITSFYLAWRRPCGAGRWTLRRRRRAGADVLKVWLPSMRFHMADLAGAVANDAVDAAIRAASVVLWITSTASSSAATSSRRGFRQRGLLLVHDFTPHAGPGPRPMAPGGGARTTRFSRSTGTTATLLWSSLAVFARPADFATTSRRGREGRRMRVTAPLEPPRDPVGDC